MDDANVRYGVDFMCCMHEENGKTASFGTRKGMEFLLSPDTQKAFTSHFTD